jgi:hypothetical protein
MEKSKEPGSARLGNFINYYSFNPPERRLKLVPKSLLRDFCGSAGKHEVVALDVGCNAGVCFLLHWCDHNHCWKL